MRHDGFQWVRWIILGSLWIPLSPDIPTIKIVLHDLNPYCKFISKFNEIRLNKNLSKRSLQFYHKTFKTISSELLLKSTAEVMPLMLHPIVVYTF